MDDERTVRFENAMMQAGFTAVPNVVLLDGGLSPNARLLYALLCHYARQRAECFPGQERLAENLGMTDRTIRRIIGELRKAGLLATQRRGLGQTNVYVLLDRRDGPVGPDTGVHSEQTPVSDKEEAVEEDADQEQQAPDDVERVWAYWLRTRRPVRHKLEPAQAKLIRRALNADFEVDELCRAIDALLASDWHRQHRQLQLSTIFATRPGGPTLRDQIERWIERSPTSPAPTGARGGVTAEAIRRAKDDVLRAYDSPDNEQLAQLRDQGIEYLARFGIAVEPGHNGRPTFVEAQR